jgi:hypothetical protein
MASVVAHTCLPSYLGGGAQEVCVLRTRLTVESLPQPVKLNVIVCTCHPSKRMDRRVTVQDNLGKNVRLYLKND